jgi:hypothetical protein
LTGVRRSSAAETKTLPQALFKVATAGLLQSCYCSSGVVYFHVI